MTFDMSVANTEGNILKNLARDERMINYSNLFYKTGDPGIKNFDFLKRFGTLFDLLIDFLNVKTNINKAKQEQKEMINKIDELKNLILLKAKSITKKKAESIIKKT